MKAIVLCGGLGTRLGELTRQTPKPLMSVAGRPFLAHVLDMLCRHDIDGFILGTGFLSDQVSAIMGTSWQGRCIDYSVESTPLGTGGAIRKAMNDFSLDMALIANGDTLFSCDISKLLRDYEFSHSVTQMALRYVEDSSRYGRVLLSEESRIIGFGEKSHDGPGLINAGVYVQAYAPLDHFGGQPFSFEADYLAVEHKKWPIYGTRCEGYFIDIGIPEDLEKARIDLTRSYSSD